MDDLNDELTGDAPAEVAPEPISIKIVGDMTLVKALDPERYEKDKTPPEKGFGARTLRYRSTHDWMTSHLTTDGGARVLAPPGVVSVEAKQELLKGPVTIGYKPDQHLEGGPQLKWHVGAKLRGPDLSRIFSLPLLFGGSASFNAAVMSGDAVVTFPGEDSNGEVADEALPLDPAPEPWAGTFTEEELERAAVIVGNGFMDKRELFQAKVRRVRVSGKELLANYEATVHSFKNLGDVERKHVTSAQAARVVAHHEKLIERLNKLAVAEGGGDLNTLQLIVYQYAVISTSKPYTTNYLKAGKKFEEDHLRRHIVEHDNQFLLNVTFTSNSLAGNVYCFEHEFKVPFLSSFAWNQVKKKYNETLEARAKEAPKAAASVDNGVRAAPVTALQGGLATAANTEAVVAAAKKESAAAAAAGTIGADLAAVHEELTTKKLEPASAPASEKKTKAAAKKDVDADADVDDKKEAREAAEATAVTPAAAAAGKRKVAEAAEAERPAKRAAATPAKATANGTEEKPKAVAAPTTPAAAASATAGESGHYELVVPGSISHREKCWAVTKKFGQILAGAAGKKFSDQKAYGDIRGFTADMADGDPKHPTDEQFKARLTVGQLYQICNYLGVAKQMHTMLVATHLEPAVVATTKGNDDDEAGF